jgi:3-oxoacyl-[acyl-carrier protein] reductase
MELRFDDKVVLITGASSGIGRAMALVFGQSGAKTVLNFNHRREQAEDAVGLITKSNGRAFAWQADVTCAKAVGDMVAQTVREFGPVDILVNNAGAALGLCPVTEMTEEFFDKVMDVNLRSAFLCSRAVLEPMIEKKDGVIINISSVVARHGGGAGELAYTTAKGALSSFTRGLAREVAKHNIRVNTIAPGPTRTAFHENIFDPEKLQSLIPRIPLGRLGKPEDMVGTALLLASEAGNYITGQSIEINGGFWIV